MSERWAPLSEVGSQAVSDLLQQIVREQRALTVLMANGEAVEIRPLEKLEPLPELEGTVPEGWKDAIYAR